MGKVISFSRQKKDSASSKNFNEADKLKQISDKIDHLILNSLNRRELEPYEVVGLLAHRLGTLMRHMEQKRRVWDICEKVLKKQAIID
ncbi:MAG: hypothetical protein KA436_02835 [Oligoflexales bacterium]|nr:hypothetical protein [Oligoflexales bacterium]